MAMMRSALARVFRRSSGSCRAPRRRPETDQAPPPLPSLRPAAPAPWVLPRPGSATHPQPQMVRTFMSAAAASAPNRRIPNLNLLQGQRYFPVISKGTEGMKWAGQKTFLSAERNANSGAKLMESARLAARRINEWGNRPSSAKTEFVLRIPIPQVLLFVSAPETQNLSSKSANSKISQEVADNHSQLGLLSVF
uniref:Uncharacterized protein n=1 Tax=Oryza punctata TaxID=4537 RepID=A0A0E0LGF5_ORYPU